MRQPGFPGGTVTASESAWGKHNPSPAPFLGLTVHWKFLLMLKSSCLSGGWRTGTWSSRVSELGWMWLCLGGGMRRVQPGLCSLVKGDFWGVLAVMGCRVCVCAGRLLPEVLQQLRDGRSGCAACAGGRRWLLGALEMAPTGGRLRRCESSVGLPPGWKCAVVPLEDGGKGCGVAVPSRDPSAPGAERPLGVLHHLVTQQETIC